MERRRSFSWGLLGVALITASCAGQRPATTSQAQLDFGVEMARRGLWSEAYFRFQQADRLQPRDAETLNNLAVACEALGKFEEAMTYYRQALDLDPSDRDLRANYDRFVSFYESFRARAEDEEGEDPAQAEGGAETASRTASAEGKEAAS